MASSNETMKTVLSIRIVCVQRDALVRTKAGTVIPVEHKRRIAPPRDPYDTDLIPAIACGMLVEDRYGQPPPYVRIQYANRWFDELYTGTAKGVGIGGEPAVAVGANGG